MSNTPRHFARLRTRESASLVFANGETIACVVHDFSKKGLKLQALDRGAAAHIATSHRQDEAVTVKFLAELGERYRPLQGKLTHQSAADFGIYLLEDMPAEVFQAMAQARVKLPQNGHADDVLLPEESQAILRDCINLFRIFLGQAWQTLLEDIKWKIAEQDTDHLPLADHSRYLNGLTDMQIRIDEISQRHFDMLIERMYKIGEIKENASPQSGDELSILDEDSFEDWLNISALFNRINVDNRSAMYQFAQRFSRLNAVPIGPHNDPFGPQAVCLTFQDTLRELDFNNDMRAILYRQFGKALQADYGKLYEQLNQLLAPLKPVQPSRLRDTGDARDRIGASGNDRSAAEHPHSEAAVEATPDSVAKQTSKLADIAERLFALYPPLGGSSGIRGETTAVDSSPPPTGEAGASAADHGALNMASYLQQLHLILERISDRSTPLTQVSVAAHSGDGEVNRIDGLLALLGAKQTATSETSLSERLDRSLAQPEFAAELALPLRQQLGAMASLLSHALAEHGNQSDIELLLKKLEQPIYDLALRGEAPARLENHPLGRLIDLVDRFAIVADDNGHFHDPQFRELVGSIIDKGISQRNVDANSLETTCAALDKLLKFPVRARTQKIAGYQEINETRGWIRDNNRRVVEELNRQLASRVIAKVIPRLLELGWQHWLVLVKLRGDTAEWVQSWRLLADLLTIVEQTPTAAADNATSPLLDAFEARLATVIVDRRQLAELMQELADYVRAPNQAERVKIPEGWLSPPEGALPRDETLAGQLRVGDWWDIEQDGKPVPMQLIWLSQARARVCFVNRSATSKLDLTLNELAERMRRDQAKPGEDRDLPLLERSEYGAIDAMYRHLAQQANQDPITNLPNRKSLVRLVGHGAHFHGVSSFCVLSFEPYRIIFDHCGAEAGEDLTRTLAVMAQRSLGANDRLAMLSEGSFAAFLPGLDLDAARELTTRLSRNFDGYHFQHDSENFSIQTFFGVASYRSGVIDPDEALRRAASACEVARSIGPGTIQVYADSDNLIQDRETMDNWAGQIDQMLSGDRLFLRCQKIVPLQEPDALPHYEVLLGVLDENGVEAVSPQPFVLAVERWQRAHDLDLWVVNGMLDWIRRNRVDFDRTGGFSVNLSAQSLANADLLAVLHRELAVGDLPCDRITFEITETATLQSHAVAQDFMRQIRRYGCRFSLDDFGSGNASFGYLRSLHTDTLKIDGAFVKDMVDDPQLQAMVKSMNEIGHALGMKTVAEFVASPEILAMVREIGVDYGQGYEIEKPIKINQLIVKT